jgi:diguanylate cyclase (GGDEF)-like protein
MWVELKRTGQWRGELWNRHKNGQIYPELMTISAVVDSGGELTHYVGVFRDITHLKRSEEKLAYLAHHDALTGLPNRTLFQARLEQCLQRAARYQRQVGLVFLDLDRFKTVNDTLGHPVGDALLKQVATVLAKQVREADTIARLGGDEFVIILDDIPALRFAANFVERLLTVFAQPFLVEGHELFVTASIGVSVYPQDGEEIDALVRHADVAMYQTKNSGRNGFSFFSATMTEGATERLRLEHDLHGALQRHEFVLHYQPQFSLETRQLMGVEALCRWNHPTLGLVPPNQFIPIAEDVGLIDRLGAWVLEESCRQMIAWDHAGFRVPRLAVNLSVRELERTNLVDEITDILQRTGITPDRLELEVTESMIMRNPEVGIQTLAALRELGVTLAVDDFGTGYSSLAYLKRLPLNRLKIDRSFVEKLTQDPNDDAIVRAILALGRSLGLETLAEGIETLAQVDFLVAEGCVEGQGYLFSRPLPPDELAVS